MQRDDRGHYLELSNVLPVPVVVTELRFADGENASSARFARAAGIELPIQLGPTAFQSSPASLRIDFQLPPGVNGAFPAVEGVAAVQGQSRSYDFRAVAYEPPLARSPVPRSSLARALERHPFLTHDAEAGELRARPGTWEVDGSLVLPEGMGLRLPAGTTLRFAAGEGLIASGPLRFEGRASEPVRLEGSDPDEPGGLWSGVAVLGSARPSHWSHVHVIGTGGFEREGWSLDAGVVFHRSDVRMESCRFVGNRSEDALNIIRSRFALVDVEVTDAASDAFDADFSEGRVEGGEMRVAMHDRGAMRLVQRVGDLNAVLESLVE